jgi:hypothetical protein
LVLIVFILRRLPLSNRSRRSCGFELCLSKSSISFVVEERFEKNEVFKGTSGVGSLPFDMSHLGISFNLLTAAVLGKVLDFGFKSQVF